LTFRLVFKPRAIPLLVTSGEPCPIGIRLSRSERVESDRAEIGPKSHDVEAVSFTVAAYVLEAVAAAAGLVAALRLGGTLPSATLSAVE
jgi:hypothetical protein